jgi:hypothetical protein
MAAIGLLLFAPWLLRLAHNPGFHAFLGGQGQFFIVKTPPKFIAWYYWLFASPPTVVLAIAGMGVGIVRFTRPDRLMLIYTAGWIAALLLVGAYPREALALLPAVALWAARATIEIWTLARAVRLPRRFPTAMAAVCVAAVLIGQMVPLPHLLTISTLGYANAAAITNRYQAAGATLFVRTQPVAFLYLHRYPYYVATQSSIRELNANGADIYFMTDHTLTSHADLMDFFDLNRDRLQVVTRVPNQLYPETILLPATEEGLSHVDDPPVVFRFIIIWHATGALQYPATWSG